MRKIVCATCLFYKFLDIILHKTLLHAGSQIYFASLTHLSTSSPILALAATSSSGSPGAFAYMSTQ